MSFVKKAGLVVLFVSAVVSGQFGKLLSVASHAVISEAVAAAPGAGGASGNSCG
jgi:hypothetical protein